MDTSPDSKRNTNNLDEEFVGMNSISDFNFDIDDDLKNGDVLSFDIRGVLKDDNIQKDISTYLPKQTPVTENSQERMRTSAESNYKAYPDEIKSVAGPDKKLKTPEDTYKSMKNVGENISPSENQTKVSKIHLNDLLDSNDIIDDTPTQKDPVTSLASLDKRNKIVIIVFLILVVLCVISLVIKSITKGLSNTKDESIKHMEKLVSDKPSNGITILANEAFEVDDERSKDYVIVKKQSLMWDNSMVPFISGTGTKDELVFKIYVDTKTYNSYTNGQIVEVSYNKMSVDNKIYATNIKLGKVVGE